MTKKQFVQQLTGLLRKKYADKGWQVDGDLFLKNNDTDKYGILFHPPDGTVTPTIYIDEFYKDYVNKKSTLSEITEHIQMLLDVLQGQMPKYEEIAVDFASCQSKIVYRLVSQGKNSQLLQTCPYLPFLDLAITFHVVCSCSEQGLESLRVTNQLMQKWGTGIRELMRLAETNTPRLFPPQIETLRDVLGRYLGGQKGRMGESGERAAECGEEILMLTNRQGVNGAAVVLYRDLMKHLSAEHNTNYFLVPSSIHEVLLMPDSWGASLTELSQMVKEINGEHVHREDILSDHAYFYNGEENKFYY